MKKFWNIWKLSQTILQTHAHPLSDLIPEEAEAEVEEELDAGNMEATETSLSTTRLLNNST